MRTTRRTLPVALTIAGSDSGGGAGIQADLKVFAALGVHGTSALTCVTAQNPSGVRAVQACRPGMVRAQIEAVFEELPPKAAKTGMLFDGSLIEAVADCWVARRRVPLVVDPVMIATSGAQLLRADAVRVLQRRLLPLAAVVTPNVDEAQLLTGLAIRDEEDLRKAARALYQAFGCAVLVKGGHLKGARQAMDIYYDGREELLLAAPFVRNLSTHGTGCAYSAAITAYLASGSPLPQAVSKAKELITQAIARSVRVGHHTALNPLWTL